MSVPQSVHEYLSQIGAKGGSIGGRASGPRKARTPEQARAAVMFRHERNRRVDLALLKAREVLEVWQATYAPEHCLPEAVERARARVAEAGGILAYIAEASEQINETIDFLTQKKGTK